MKLNVQRMPYQQPSRPQTQLDSQSTAMAYNSLFSQRGLPFFLADQAVGDILQELAAEHLADREAKQFVKNCLKTISPGDKEFLALFRWRVEAVPLGGKPTVRILPHIISPELRSAIIKDLIRYQSWGPINGFEWQSISDAWSRNGDLVFQRLHVTISLNASCLGTQILTWDV